MSAHSSRGLRFESMTSTTPLSGLMISRIKWNLPEVINYTLNIE